MKQIIKLRRNREGAIQGKSEQAMPSSRFLPGLSLSLGFLLGCLVYSRCVLGAAVAWSSALWFLAAKEALWLDHSKSLYFKLPKTLGLRRMVEDLYNLRPVFLFFCFFPLERFSVHCVHMCSSTDGDSNDCQTLWCEFKFPEGVGMSVKHQMPFCLSFCFFFFLSKYILILCWCEISFYLGKGLTVSLKNCSFKKKNFWVSGR